MKFRLSCGIILHAVYDIHILIPEVKLVIMFITQTRTKCLQLFPPARASLCSHARRVAVNLSSM
jgi:hypothetical protein